MGRFKKLKNNAIYCFIRGTLVLFNIIPHWLAVSLGALLGYLASFLYKKDRRKAERHLQLAYGESLSEMERKKIARDVFVNFGRNAADVFRLKKHYHRQIAPLIDFEGREYFDRVYNRGSGVIAVTGHIGNFELLAAHIANSGYKAAVIGRELYDKRLNRLLLDNREAMGEKVIDTHDPPRRVVQLLKEGYVLGVLIDTDSMRVRSMFVPAFGRLSNTPVGQSVLGLKTGAGFVAVACVRTGKRYKIIFKPEITIDRTDDFEKDVYNITRKSNEALEEIITEYKDQWIWIHDRWLTKPEKPIN